MKLLWAVSALLLSCWRASASTGKNSVSAMLVEDVDFAPTTTVKFVCLEFRSVNVTTVKTFDMK